MHDRSRQVFKTKNNTRLIIEAKIIGQRKLEFKFESRSERSKKWFSIEEKYIKTNFKTI